jgi:pimeloyl-ACP methyl ester carboxylesterase
VINFVGGWLGTGCGTAAEINGALFRRGGGFGGPAIWLYGRNDPYYPIGHSRANFAAFQGAGGKGEFFEFHVPGKNGHALNAYPELWIAAVEAFMRAVDGTPMKP